MAAVLTAAAQPVNDNFANRLAIADTGTISGSLSNATSEIGEPFIPDVSSGQTAWWTWTAPSNGVVQLSASGTGFNPLLTAYSGTDLASLSLIASNTYLACYESAVCGCHWRLRDHTTFHAIGGQAYQIAVDSALVTDTTWVRSEPTIPTPENPYPLLYRPWVSIQTTNLLPGGDLQLGFQFTPAPANDDFEQRMILPSAQNVFRLASNAGASAQPGEPNHLGNSGGSSVWFSWTAPASGRVTLSTNSLPPYLPPSWWSGGSGYGLISIGTWYQVDLPPSCGKEIDQNPPPAFYPLLAAYTGETLESLVPANCLPLELAAFPYAISFEAVEGQTYQIAVDGNQGTTGDFAFFLSLTTPAANDNFANRIQVHGINVVATGYNAGATHEADEPAPAPGSNGQSVWWSWTAPASGTASLDLGGSDHISMPVAVFTGDELANLQLFASGSGDGFTFDVIAGQTYQISVSDQQGLTGTIRLNLTGPVVELPLLRAKRSGKKALLRYASSPGQVVLLQRCTDGVTWNDVKVVTARKKPVEFLVRPAPKPDGAVYQAIIVDTR